MMCNHSCGCRQNGSGSCPFSRLQELSRMCGCSSGVIAEVISSCDCFCRPQSCERRGCGCRNE